MQQERLHSLSGSEVAMPENREGPPLVNDPGEICVMIGIAKLVYRLQRLLGSDAVIELFGERKDQHDPCFFIVRIDRQDVAADALGLPWLAQEPVTLRLG